MKKLCAKRGNVGHQFFSGGNCPNIDVTDRHEIKAWRQPCRWLSQGLIVVRQSIRTRYNATFYRVSERIRGLCGLLQLRPISRCAWALILSKRAVTRVRTPSEIWAGGLCQCRELSDTSLPKCVLH